MSLLYGTDALPMSSVGRVAAGVVLFCYTFGVRRRHDVSQRQVCNSHLILPRILGYAMKPLPTSVVLVAPYFNQPWPVHYA